MIFYTNGGRKPIKKTARQSDFEIKVTCIRQLELICDRKVFNILTKQVKEAEVTQYDNDLPEAMATKQLKFTSAQSTCRSIYTPGLSRVISYSKWLTDGLTDGVTNWLTDKRTDRLTDWLTDWLTGWLTDNQDRLLKSFVWAYGNTEGMLGPTPSFFVYLVINKYIAFIGLPGFVFPCWDGITYLALKGAMSRWICSFRSILCLNHYFEALIMNKMLL